MKFFIEPNGLFIIKIPIDWQYKNVAIGYKEESPFGFELYRGKVGAFQISCYSTKDKLVNPNHKIQKADTKKLDFVQFRMDDEQFNVHIWGANVEDHMFLAKYIYDATKANTPKIIRELKKVEDALSQLELISEPRRSLAVEIDKYDKFMASLLASFDLKNKAVKAKSLIELMIITANQIDAYLRMAIVLTKQIEEMSERIDIKLLFQGENDPPVMERKIYQQAKDRGIIDADIFDKLELLYKERNKVVHRYIITDFKTRDLHRIVYDYELAVEKVRLALKAVEDNQFKQGIGVYGGRDPSQQPDPNDLQILYSQINDKHLLRDLYRKIKD
ncbi:MAG: hypothetical protein ACHQIM_11975 [Sphingobacteriales bacterium]